MAGRAGRHSREEIAAFLVQGETAQVVARDTRSGELVVMENGQALELRDVAKAHFSCPVEGCPSPRLETVGGRTRRHHFRHASGGGHHGSAESMLHLQAKFILGEWARRSAARQGIDVEVIVDEAFVTDVERRRRRKPDVLVRFPDGTQVALEVEYFNSTDDTSLAARRTDYEAFGVRDVWVLGHASRHVRQPRANDYAPDGHVLFSSVSAALAAAGDPVLIINPLEGLVGTLVRDVPPGGWSAHGGASWWAHPEDFGLVFPDQRYPRDTAEVRLDHLDDCVLDVRYGILTPAIRAVLESREQMRQRALRERAQAEERERQRKHAEEQARVRALARQEAGEKAALDATKRRETALRLRAERERAWQTDPVRQRILTAEGGIPTVIATELPTDNGVFAYHQKWHATLFQEFVLGKPLGSTFTVADVYRALGRAGIELHHQSDRRGKAVVGYLHYLRECGHIRFDTVGVMVTGPITVTANTPTAPAPAPTPARRPVSAAARRAAPPAPDAAGPSPAASLAPHVHWHVRAARFLTANRHADVHLLRTGAGLTATVSDAEISAFITEVTGYWAQKQAAAADPPISQDPLADPDA